MTVVFHDGELTPKIALAKRDKAAEMGRYYSHDDKLLIEKVGLDIDYRNPEGVEEMKWKYRQLVIDMLKADVFIWQKETWEASGNNSHVFIESAADSLIEIPNPMCWQFDFALKITDEGIIKNLGLSGICFVQQQFLFPFFDSMRNKNAMLSCLILCPDVRHLRDGEGLRSGVDEKIALPHLRFFQPLFFGETIGNYFDTVARLQYLNLKVARVDRQHLSNKVTRQYTRKNIHVPEVSIVRLRGVQADDRQRANARASTIEYSCQWTVRGHWRQQFYPSKGRHKPVFVDEYIKGPEDKPLKEKAAVVFKVDR
jgi:hypothetical protein